MMPVVDRLQGAGAFADPPEGLPNFFVEHCRVATMSVGTYSIPAGGIDDQTRHREDEVYAVMSGRALFSSGTETTEVRPGDVLFVAAGEEHRFHDVAEDLALLVVFAPPYSGD
jgi:mannose-6-phosphate isomerase-like protein (cupin superfamily)